MIQSARLSGNDTFAYLNGCGQIVPLEEEPQDSFPVSSLTARRIGWTATEESTDAHARSGPRQKNAMKASFPPSSAVKWRVIHELGVGDLEGGYDAPGY